MTDIAIRIENLSKLYRLGSRAPYHRFTDLIVGVAKAPLRTLAELFRKPIPPSAESSPAAETDAPPGYFWALKDINLEIKRGEVVGIIGRNGAGKSTLLKILSRITEPTKGRVTLQGRVGSLLEVGTGFHPELTGRENIYLNGAILGMTRAEINRRFDEIVSFAEVSRFLDVPVKRYSSGMHTRLAFSVAAHMQPEILLVDEVLAVGDSSFQRKCIDKISDVAKGGRTVLFVSHNLASVRSLAENAVLLRNGKLAASGPTPDIINLYSTEVRTSLESLPFHCEDLAVQSFRVRQHGQTTADVDGGNSFTVEIEYEVFHQLGGFRIGFFLVSPSVGVLTRSLITDLNADCETQDKGRYLASVTFPPHSLLGGNYQMILHASRFGIRDYLHHLQVSLPVTVHQSHRFNANHSDERFEAVFLLGQPWNVEPIPAAANRDARCSPSE
jgi:lipopolysaccharide transport system ATP-binding protein